MTEAALPAGTLLELDIGEPGHGGFCVARHEGRVVFVRHALPGERVRARVTEDTGGSFCRADAVEILIAGPHRVAPPCPHAGPGRCGGCDWQHATAAAQRELKAAVVRAQFARLAGIQLDLPTVEALPGGLLGWRTRVSYAIDPNASVGLHRHRSHEVEPVRTCPLGAAMVCDAPPAPPGASAVELACGDDGAPAVLAHRPGRGGHTRGRRPPDKVELIGGPRRLRHQVGQRVLEADASGFWQVHPRALESFTAALLAALDPQPGQRVLDLYAGAGPLSSVLADAVGPGGQVLGIEASRAAVADAAANLAGRRWARVRRGRVDAALIAGLDLRPDLVVLDPPRAGAGPATMAAILALRPQRVAYLSCDPATLARDVRAAGESGWRLVALRAFDAFPMTHHVECLAHLQPAD